MMNDIKRAGGLFYQYRPCYRSYTTIYDIDNIRNGVVFSRPPLNMNDPFDSQIGYSSEKIFDECLDIILENYDWNNFTKSLLKILLQNRLLGRFAELLKAINELKLFLIQQRRGMYKASLSLEDFVVQQGKNLYKKAPTSIKRIINKENFVLVCILAAHFENTEITKESLDAFLQGDEILENLQKQVELLMQDVYIPLFKEFLSKLPISCFSAAGWDCSLMWAHYANSYKGICIEYDFNQLTEFVGFIRQVQYSSQRPLISLKDLGIAGLNPSQEEKISYVEPNIDKILKYLTTKDTCWQYEEEWRLMYVYDKPVDKHFFSMPFVKSVTMGINIDYLCKRLILDICKEKEIECYQLKLGHDDFKITREKIDVENIEYDEQVELDYVHLLTDDIITNCESIEKLSSEIMNSTQNGDFNRLSLKIVLQKILSYFECIFFLKLSCNRFCSNLLDLTDAPLALQENISQLEISTNTFHEAILDLTHIIQQAMENRYMGKDLYDEFMKTIGTIEDLYNKYQVTPWHTALMINK